jgi:ribose 5-phosphate isomerase B
MKNNPIILASDHAGFKLKEAIKAFLHDKGYKTDDVGAHAYVEDDDYPAFMSQAALKIAEDMSGHSRAIIFGKSGEGEAIVANRYPGVRAVVWYGSAVRSDLDIIKLSREHNDANVLSIGAGFVTEAEAVEAVIEWLETPFSGEERHKRRIEEIDSVE